MKTYIVYIDSLGTKRWYFNNKPHREDGPAVEYANGSKEWRLNGKIHREDGPAVECANGTKYWYLDGMIHREDGPAVEYANGTKEWRLNGTPMTEAEFLKRTKLKTYKIGVVWQMYGYVEVEAVDIDEAIYNAMEAPLPDNGEYIEGSFEVDVEGSALNEID
jgi:hypothetical protein